MNLSFSSLPAFYHWPMVARLFALTPDTASLRFVGGAVRDGWLGRPVTDIDMATSDAPELWMERLARAGIGYLTHGLTHGTLTIPHTYGAIDITTLRRDVACDGRHALVAYTDSWEEDAARRDFTMNALYATHAGEIYDCHEGLSDLGQGIVRFIGDPEQCIGEDFLRILRFFRFFAHYGKGVPNEEGLAACAAHAPAIGTLSAERVQHEMLSLLRAEDPLSALEAMLESGVWSHTAGTALDLSVMARLIVFEQEHALPPTALRRMGAFLMMDPSAGQLIARWKLPNLYRDAYAEYGRFPVTAEISVRAMQKIQRRMSHTSLEDRCALLAACYPECAAEAAALLATLQSQPIPQFPVRGRDLLACGYSAGPELGDMLRHLERLWEESAYTLDDATLLDIARASENRAKNRT